MQILKENKDKKDAEFNERFKHSECSNLSNIVFFLHLYEYELHLSFSLMEEKKFSQRILLLLSAHSLHSLFTGPPKALDDDETEFLDQWETVRSCFHDSMLLMLVALMLKHINSIKFLL